jgi:hypothetical protein
MRIRSAVLLVGACLLLPLLAAPAALAAKLIGGREQTAIERAFTAQPAHRHQLIVSVRASTVAPAWAAVRSVNAEGGGRTTSSAAAPKLQIAYYRRVGGSEHPGAPPPAVRADLQRDFQVAVVYTGSGSESVVYGQTYRSVCAGAGYFTDQQTVTVSPMSWTVRYVVNLDDLVAAVRSSAGAVLLPSVSFDGGGSRLDVVETLSRTLVDAGCNGNPTTFNCRVGFRLGGSDPGDQLSFPPAAGIEVGVPMVASSAGACDPSDYTLGPSLWDSGAGAALVSQLGLIGGSLPANPYAPIRVTWPGGSAQHALGFATSPCQGDGSACSDDFHWTGTVALRPVPAS